MGCRVPRPAFRPAPAEVVLLSDSRLVLEPAPTQFGGRNGGSLRISTPNVININSVVAGYSGGRVRQSRSGQVEADAEVGPNHKRPETTEARQTDSLSRPLFDSEALGGQSEYLPLRKSLSGSRFNPATAYGAKQTLIF